MPAMATARPFIPALAATILFSAFLRATPQQPPASDQSQLPTFRTGANLVRVDATVLDHRGQPVPSLKAEDFLQKVKLICGTADCEEYRQLRAVIDGTASY